MGDGLDGDFWEEGLPSCIQSKLECPPWQLVPLRDYSNAEHFLAATGFTPLLVNLESITTKPNAGVGSRLRRIESREGRALFGT